MLATKSFLSKYRSYQKFYLIIVLTSLLEKIILHIAKFFLSIFKTLKSPFDVDFVGQVSLTGNVLIEEYR